MAPLGHYVRRALSAEVVAGLLSRVPKLQWLDGRSTAAGAAASVKSCQIAAVHDAALLDETGSELVKAVYAVLMGDHVRAAALPAGFSGLRFVRYRPGDGYGWHVDDAYNEQGFRSDLSFTFCLQSASDGGELECVVQDGEVATLKLAPGDVVVYPSTLCHRVTTVHAGERIVLIGWLQSLVRDAGKRSLLDELHRLTLAPSEQQADRIRAVRNELLRRWGG